MRHKQLLLVGLKIYHQRETHNCSSIARKSKRYPIGGTNLAYPIIALIYDETDS
jgi:hypothetical protein